MPSGPLSIPPDPTPFGILPGVLLLSVAIGLFLLILLPTVQARGAGRNGWWLYMVGIFVPGVNVALGIAWFAWLRRHPTHLPRWASGSRDVVV